MTYTHGNAIAKSITFYANSKKINFIKGYHDLPADVPLLDICYF